MSRKFKSQASAASARAASATLPSFGFGSTPSAGFQTAPSSLSYVAEQPDLNIVSDANLVVILRNLGKKDSITKTKALEDLQEYVNSVESGETIDAGLLEAWIALYPRTSIDNARRVRQLAHGLQGSLTALAGKRIAPHLPRVIGAWLSGVYDSDRLVARTAQESISVAFNTDERKRALWKIYKTSLTEYANDAILTQTIQTLSDERSTTPDDAEAKFIRVVGNAIQMFSQLIKLNYPADKEARHATDNIQTIIGDKKLWEYASHEDPTLRKAVCTLAVTCATSIGQDLQWETISACFIGKALQSNQLGSSRQFSEALVVLTTSRPSIWTTDYTSKTPASKKLFQYLRKGSQRGSPDFWSDIKLLVQNIPISAWRPITSSDRINTDSAVALLESLRGGINNSDEPRQNLKTAWSIYAEIAFWTLSLLDDDQSRVDLLETSVIPLVTQNISSDPGKSQWSVPTSLSGAIAGKVLVSILHRGLHSLFENTWIGLCQQLSDSMKLSLPESSKEYVQSQDSVVAQAERLSRLRALIIEDQQLTLPQKDQATATILQVDASLMDTAIDLLRTRNGKPYAAATVLATIAPLAESPSKTLTGFLESDALTLLASPSAEYLVPLFLWTGGNLKAVIQRLISTSENHNASQALARFLRSMSEPDILEHPGLESFLLDQIPSELENSPTQEIIKSVLSSPKLTSSILIKKCCEKLLDQLSSQTATQSQHIVLRFLVGLHATRIPSPFPEDMGSLLLSKLLLLADSDDEETSELASGLLAKLKTASAGVSSTTASSVILVTDQLSGKGDPVSIFVLVDLAKDILKSSISSKEDLARSLFPDASRWVQLLDGYFNSRPPLSMTITSPLRGLLFIVEQESPIALAELHDSDGFSPLFRLVLYTTKLMLETDISAMQSEDQWSTMLLYYPLALQLINEKLTMEVANDAWHAISDETTEIAAETLSQGKSLIHKWIADEPIRKLWIEAIRGTDTLDPRSYYYGLAFNEVVSRIVDEQGPSVIVSAFQTDIKELHRSNEVVQSAGLISVCREYFVSSQPGQKLLNDLVAAITGLKLPLTSNMALRPLVLLDLLLSGSTEPLTSIPSQRQNFLMQSLARILSDDLAGSNLQTLALRVLEPLVGAIKDLYGSHWERFVECVTSTLENESDLDQDLPLLHATLRLYARLRSLANEDEANEDLNDAWNSKRQSLEEGLLRCLYSFKHTTNAVNQPRRITSELVQRQLSQITARHDVTLYPLLSSQENAVQGAAYDLLHRSIPAEQEQISFDLALEKKEAHLPPELLTLLSDTPRASPDAPLLERYGYLLCWNLVFDHFPNASYKVQECYVAEIKEAAKLGILLDLICEVCRITSNRPVDASKVDVRDYEQSASETEQQRQQHLAIHLYYLCLLHLPGLTRSWYIEQKNRVKSPLESWTQRYFAPMLMSAASAAVTAWAQTQSQDEGESPVAVKPSLTGAEMVASIAVDPESPSVSLAILLPKSYPLESPTVVSRSRVGISEKNWQSWLRTIQIIIFSTGSIIEGLVAFRRNVQGALKGQSECAICYSIIGTDMQTPNKRCGTCRNNFHGSCLFRWFRSSNSSSCPLCRNNFNYA